MTEKNLQTLSIKLLDRHFHVKCPANKLEDLKAAAKRLDAMLVTLRDRAHSKLVNMEQLLVIAALNLNHELHQHLQQECAALSPVLHTFDDEKNLDKVF